jgi:HSP20 family protein
MPISGHRKRQEQEGIPMPRVDVKMTGNGAEKAERAVATRGASYPMESFRSEMDWLFDDLFGGRAMMPFPRSLFDWDVEPFGDLTKRLGAVAPRIDVRESDKAFTIDAELPGMDEDDIELTLSDGLLTLKGEKKEEREEKKEDYYLSERRYGSFKRTFRVPDSVEQDEVSASFRKGVLTVAMPKSAKVRKEEKRIKIKAA